jgi:hypothetical protein
LIAGEARTFSGVLPQGWIVIPYTQTGKDNIYEFIRIHREDPYNKNSSLEYDFMVTSSGARILGFATTVTLGVSSVYVTYKKELSAFTTSSTDIPEEWFNYIAQGAYADFLRMDDQTDKALAEEQVAYNYIAQELEKVDNIMNNNTVLNKYSTHLNRQSRW